MISKRVELETKFNQILEEVNLSRDELPQNLNEEI